MKTIPLRRALAGLVPVASLAAAAPALAGHSWLGGSWQTAVSVTAVNTGAGEGCPIETPDGLSLIIASSRDGNLDLWAADRSAVDAPWQAPRKLPAPINSNANDFCPLPGDGRALLFVSERGAPGACGGGDIYTARQSPAGGWSEPAALGCAPDGPNTAGPERSPSIVETRYGTFLFYSTLGSAGDHDIFVSRLGRDGRYGPGQLVESLSTPYDDLMPNVRSGPFNSYEIVFNSNRPTWGYRGREAFGGQDVYTAVTWYPLGRWSEPVNVGSGVNTGGDETRATLSGDGGRLHFGRDGDIFVSER